MASKINQSENNSMKGSEKQVETSRPSTMPLSPAMQNRRYNREKYYSALKTGFKHMDQGKKVGESFLKPPKEDALPILFPLMGPQVDEDGNEQKSSSLIIIFSCWNTMVGSAVVSLPWAFQNSGILLGITISFTSFLISFYTCALIIKTAKKDSDYIFTLKKYYGK